MRSESIETLVSLSLSKLLYLVVDVCMCNVYIARYYVVLVAVFNFLVLSRTQGTQTIEEVAMTVRPTLGMLVQTSIATLLHQAVIY